MVRHHPQWHAVRAHIRAGDIGTLRFMQVPFSYFNADAANIRNQAALGAGALYDIGCYAITAGRWFFEAEPQQAVAWIEVDPSFGTDRLTSGLLGFAGGGQLAFSVSTQSVRYQRMQLVGTTGRIEIEIPFNAPEAEPCRYMIQRAGGTEAQTITRPAADQYQLQCKAFSHAIRFDAPTAAGLDEAAAGLRVIDALFASAKSGRVERP